MRRCDRCGRVTKDEHETICRACGAATKTAAAEPDAKPDDWRPGDPIPPDKQMTRDGTKLESKWGSVEDKLVVTTDMEKSATHERPRPRGDRPF